MLQLIDTAEIIKHSKTHPGRIDWERTQMALNEYFEREMREGRLTVSEYADCLRRVPETIAYLKRNKHYNNKKRKEGKV